MSHRRPSSSPFRTLAAAGLLLLLASCGGENSYEFTDVRERSQPRHRVPPNLSPEERLGLKARSTSRKVPLTWRTPAGWEEYDAGSPMRSASWRVRGEAQTDCSLTLLPTQGGIEANVNRWRGEMGLAPIDEAAVQALPTRSLLGMEGTYLDLEGDFSGGRSAGGAVPNARMLGVILQGPKASVFLKFTGPADVVGRNKLGFEALVDSMVFDPGGSGSGAPGGGAGQPGALQWTTPEKWNPQPPRPMREATFIPEDMPEGWCYIGLIGGGIEPNLNRWRGEMGAQPLSAEAIAKLPTLSAGSSAGPFLELSGDFRGTGGDPQTDATLYGFIAPRGQGFFVFVKMVGPRDKMPAQKARFEALCRSLK